MQALVTNVAFLELCLDFHISTTILVLFFRALNLHLIVF